METSSNPWKMDTNLSAWMWRCLPWAWHCCCGSWCLDVHGSVCAQQALGFETWCPLSWTNRLEKMPPNIHLKAGDREASLPKLTCSVPRLIHLLSMAAEKVTSLGKDWHRPCLRCEKCNKTLTSGGHAEHDGKPYCNHPCYAALFGPKGFGRGGAESHTFK